MPREATIRVAVCGEPVEGVWCPSCLLPSAVAQILIIDRVPRLIQQCRDCGLRQQA